MMHSIMDGAPDGFAPCWIPCFVPCFVPNKALLVLNRDKYVLIRLGNTAGLQSSLRIMHKVRRRFMWILRTEMVSLFPGRAGGSAGSGARGAGPAGHHAGAGEEGQGVSHEDRSE